MFCDGSSIWGGNRLLAKDLLKWSVIDLGDRVMQLQFKTLLKDGTHLLMATNSTSVKIPCVYISRRKARPSQP